MPRSFLVKLRAKKNSPAFEEDAEITKGQYVTESKPFPPEDFIIISALVRANVRVLQQVNYA